MANRLTLFLTTTSAAIAAMMIIALPAPAHAQSTVPSCQRFIAIVDIVTTVSRGSDSKNRRLDTLSAQVQMLNQDDLFTQIAKAGHGNLRPTVDKYLGEIQNILKIRRISSNATSEILFSRPNFAQRHQAIAELSSDICTESGRDTSDGIGAKLTEWLGLSNSGPQAANDARKPSNASSGFGLKLNKQSQMLVQVFGILAFVLLGLYLLSYLSKLLNAIRLDRYACQIPVTLNTNNIEFRGIIDVLGNRGLSFSVNAPVTDQHYKHLTVDTPVRFIASKHEFDATLTKEFDGSAGFKLAVPLSKPLLKRLLSASRTRPRAKLEMGRRK